MKKILYSALIILFSAIFLVSAGFLADYFIKSKQQADQYDELSNLVDQAQQEQQDDTSSSENNNTIDSSDSSDSSDSHDAPKPIVSDYLTITHPDTGEKMKILREYSLIFPMNTDMVGWIKVEGTKVNYPVLQTPDTPNYYLTRDFYKKSSRHGAIYANETADLTTPSDNVTLYGHKMKDGSMFASLHSYKDKAFFTEHPYITFNTLTEHHTYQILSVFITSANIGEGFVYHTFVDGDEQTFTDFVAECKRLSLYDTQVDAVYGDKLLTLSTCDHGIDNGRFVVVAKRIS